MIIIKPLTIMAAKPTPPTPPTPSIPSVTIGNQIWMSENLHVNDGGEGILIIDETNTPVSQWDEINYYDYGIQYYYTLDAANRIIASIGDGWRLPNNNDITTLNNYIVECSKLKSTFGWYEHWDGTNDYGFNGLPTGMYSGNTNDLLTKECDWWLSDSRQFISWIYQKYARILLSGTSISPSEVRVDSGSSTTYYLPVRLIKDVT
jgi:uncharacterized protein (TIGR02145 family)